MTLRKYVSILLLSAAQFSVGAQVMVRYAGTTGVCGNAGDGGPAKSAQIAAIAMAVDNSGNVYFADWDNSVIRKVSPSGTISKYAGNGANTYSGDGGLALSAGIGTPAHMTADNAGNLFVCQFVPNPVVRKISASGIITTIAGSDTTIVYHGDGLPATSVGLADPDGIAADSHGNLFIANVNCIKKVNAAGVIGAFAGGGTGVATNGVPATSVSLLRPFSVVVDDSDNVFFGDGLAVSTPMVIRIMKVDKYGILTTYAGGGADTTDGALAINAAIHPYWISVGRNGEIYFMDDRAHKIRKISKTGVITTIAGTGISGISGDSVNAAEAVINGSFSQVFYDRHGDNLFFSDVSGTACAGETVIRKIAFGTTNVAGIGHENELAFSPNPAKGVFNLFIGGQIVGARVVVCNNVGQAVFQASVSSGATQIDIIPQPDGYYFATVVGRDGTILAAQKLLKQE